MDSPTPGAASPTYQCVVCQSTCLTPNELHRHQSYRHTSEELSLSIIGVHNAAIRTFDRPNGIVYDNSWLYDPNRHAQFYTYSANMLCDDNNNGGVVDYAFKAFKDRVVEESGPAAVADDDCTDDLDQCIGEKRENDNFAEAQNFERESWLGESKILDLRLKIDLEVESELRMDTAKDNFWGPGEGHSGDTENLGREGEKSASSETCVKSLNSEKLQTCVLDGLASKILDLGRKVFLETRTDTAADDFGNRYEESQTCGDSGNLGRDVVEKSKDPQIETCVKVQNFEEPQPCVQESEILDLSQKFCSEVQSETPMDAVEDNFGKRYEDLGSEVGHLRGETAKRRLSPSKCPAKSKARILTTPRKKPDGPKREAAKPENIENRESGNVDSVNQESQVSLSWFESEASKITKYNDKIKQIRAGQKKARDLTKLAQKQVKGGGCAKAKKRTMQSCGREDSVRLSRNFDSEDLLGFDGKGATINATSRNAKRSRVSRKKGKIGELEADKAAEETAELPKKPLDEETTGDTGIFGSEQSLFNFKRKKSQNHAPTMGKAKKPRVSWKKEKISETKADNYAELQKKQHEEETAGKTQIIVDSAERGSLIGSDQLLFDLESSKSKIHATTSGNAKKPRVSKKKEKISETDADNYAELQKKQHEEETAGETKITVDSAEHGSHISSDQLLFDLESDKSKIHATTSGNAKKPRVSKKKGKINETEGDNSGDLQKKQREEETAGETKITVHRPKHGSIIGSDQLLFDFESSKSKIHATTSGNAKKPRVSKKKGKISKTKADNSGDLQKKQREEEIAGETETTVLSAEHSLIIGSDQSLFDSESSKSKIHATPSRPAKKKRVSKKKKKISETEADNSADETVELLKKLFEEETAVETLITQNQDNGNGNSAEHVSIFSSDKYFSHVERKKSKVHATTSGNAKEPRVSRKRGNISKTEADNSAEETAELLRNLLGEETAGETQITQNQDNGSGNHAERSSTFASAESTVHFAGKEPKTDVAPSVNAKNPIASKRTTKNLETAAEAKRESTKPADQNCEQEIGSRPNWDCKSEDFPSCLDAERPKIKAMCAESAGAQADKSVADKPAEEESIEEIEKGTNQNCAKEAGLQPNWNFESPDFLACSDGDGQKIEAMCAENAGAQVEKSVADKPAEQEYIVEIKTGVDQNCAKEAGLQPNWDFESPDFLVCSDGDGQKINATHTENAGTQTENTAVESTAELLRVLLTEPSEEEAPPGTEKLQNQNYENGNRAEQSSIFGSAESTIRFDSKEAKIDTSASGRAKRPIASKKKARNPKTVADKSTERETAKPANQNCAKEVGPQPNWDFESADFLARTHGAGQKIDATCAEKAGAQAEKAAVEGTAELLRDLLTQPSEEQTPRITEKLQNEDCGNEDYAEHDSFFSSDEYLYYFPSEEARMAAMSSGCAKKPIGSGKKTSDLKPVTVWPAKQKMTRKIVNDGNGNLSKQRSGSSRDVFSYTGSESEEAKITPPMASGKKSDNLKAVTVWGAKQKTTRKIVNDGNGNSSKQSSCSTRDVFSYTGSESEEATITPLSKFRAERSSALGKKPKKINAGDENCAEHVSHFVPNIYTCADRATKEETLNSFGKKPRMINQGVENCAERNSNFVPNIYTCTDRASKQVEIKVPSAEKPKRRRVASKKSKNSERVSDKAVAKKAARGTTKLFYQNFGTEMFVSQNSPPIINVNSSTESGSEEAMPGSSSAGNVGKSVGARNKPKNLQTPEVETALPENNENREHDNVISLYKDSSPIPGGSAACDNELPPVTFVAYPPYVDENSILVMNPESRELVWRCLDTEDSQLDDTANFHWFERGSHQNFSEAGKATTSRNVDSEKSASFVPAAIGAPASNEESTLQRTNVVRRSTRPRKVIQRYNS